MGRQKSFNLIGIPQHVIQRGNNREPCFYERSDYCHYLHLLQQTALKYNCNIHAYVLMTNHVHLLVTPGLEASISQMMQSLGSQYVRFLTKNIIEQAYYGKDALNLVWFTVSLPTYLYALYRAEPSSR